MGHHWAISPSPSCLHSSLECHVTSTECFCIAGPETSNLASQWISTLSDSPKFYPFFSSMKYLLIFGVILRFCMISLSQPHTLVPYPRLLMYSPQSGDDPSSLRVLPQGLVKWVLFPFCCTASLSFQNEYSHGSLQSYTEKTFNNPS